MILLLTLALLLALPSWGWAEGLKEPVYPPYCWVQPPNTELWYKCDSEEAKMLECVNLMELAMKAMEKYQDASLPEERTRILKLWERAKNTCWSDLKDKQPQHYH